MKRIKTQFPGVFYRLVRRIGGPGQERVYYILFKKNGKLLEEKAGRQFMDAMTPARAARIRGDRIEGRRLSRKELRTGQTDRWTFDRLWLAYLENHPTLKALSTDASRYRLHVQPTLGGKSPAELVPLDLDRIRLRLSKTLKPSSVFHALEIVRRLLNFARAKELCATPTFKITMPKVDNLKTEDLDAAQLERLLHTLHSETITAPDGKTMLVDPDARDAMLMALATGMRQMEILSLAWADVDFDRGFITIRSPKGGTDATIPMNDAARDILMGRPRTEDGAYVFPGRFGGHRADVSKQFQAIRDAAGLPPDFRPMHGLRHTFASHLASSGKVDLYTLQRLLTHKSPLMTQRYAHLRDETLRAASNIAGAVLTTQGGDPGRAEARKARGES